MKNHLQRIFDKLGVSSGWSWRRMPFITSCSATGSNRPRLAVGTTTAPLPVVPNREPTGPGYSGPLPVLADDSILCDGADGSGQAQFPFRAEHVAVRLPDGRVLVFPAGGTTRRGLQEGHA